MKTFLINGVPYTVQDEVVHLIKKDEYIKNQYINPLEILVVEIDLSKNDKNYMPHGLGLGSLVCEQKRD